VVVSDTTDAPLSDAEVTVTFHLRTSAHVLDTARIESKALRDKMVDFERRRASGRGMLITRDDIDQRNRLTLADLCERSAASPSALRAGAPRSDSSARTAASMASTARRRRGSTECAPSMRTSTSSIQAKSKALSSIPDLVRSRPRIYLGRPAVVSW
jgi:hypothetical protein